VGRCRQSGGKLSPREDIRRPRPTSNGLIVRNLGLSKREGGDDRGGVEGIYRHRGAKQTVEVFEPILKKCEQLREQVSALHKEFKDVLEEEKRYRPAMILKLAEIERSLDIDPEEAAST
jgi:hypothetical protein